VPRIDRQRRVSDLSDGVADLVRRVATSWTGPAAPRVRLLPKVLDFDELHPSARERGVVIGLEGLRLEPVVLNSRQDNGLVLIGDTETGKTSTLRSIGRQVVENWQPRQAKLIVIDYKRTMLAEFSGESLLGYAATTQQTVDMVAGLIEGFTRRLPHAEVTPEQLRNRDWWTGPDIYVLVDDYDRVATTSNPLLPLLELLPSARDIGLNLIITRRAGGAGRAMHDPVINAMRELGFPIIVGSVPRDEGMLFGVPPRTQPPGRATLVDRAHGIVPIQLIKLDPEV
jgi:S-DNA-T family DNA segregation ATPase FtsK/SpoIIIE